MKTKIKKIEAIAIAAIMVVSVFAGIMPMIPMAGAYHSGGPVGGYLNNTNTNVTINSSSLVAGDAFNVTYERMTVSLNFSLNFSVNVTNISLDFGKNLVATLPTSTNGTIGNNLNITNVSSTDLGWNTSQMVRSNTTHIEFYNASAYLVGVNNVTNRTIVHFSINNVTMPSVADTTDRYINVSAIGGEDLTGNWTRVWLNITNDETAPTLPAASLVMSTLGSTDVVSAPGGIIEEVWNVTTNASNPPIWFNLNDTLSGVKNGTIRVYIDDASNVLLNATINEGNVTMDGRNATVDLTNTNRYFDTGTAGNLTAGETHTLNVTVTDNSTNKLTNHIAKTFYVPRIVLGANKTADITADGSDTINISILALKPDGSNDTDNTKSLDLLSDTGVSFNGGTHEHYADNTNGLFYVLVNFTTPGTHTITAGFNNTQNDIKIATVAVAANVTASAARPSLVANGTDSCNITLQAVDIDGDPVARSVYDVRITAVSNVEGSSANITTTQSTTDANGRDNRTLTASTIEGEVITITPKINIPGTGWVSGAPIQVPFASGDPAKMKLYSSQGTANNGILNPTNLTVTGIVAGNITTFTANITDANNHPLQYQTVTFTLLPGGLGTLITSTAETGSNGNASVDFTTGLTKGENVSIINVTVSDNASLFNYIRVSTINGTAHHLLLTASPTGLPADGASNSTVTARVVDYNDNSVLEYAGLANVTFEMSSTDYGNLSANYNLTNTSGYAEVNFTAGTTEGMVTITATANVTLPGGNTTTTTITLGIPDTIVLSADRYNVQTDGSLNATVTAALYKGDISIGMENVNMTFLLTNGTLYEYQNNTKNGTSIEVKTNDTGVAAVNVSGSGAVETVQLIVVSPDYPAINAAIEDFTFTGDATKFSLTYTTPTVPNATTGISESTLTVQLLDSADNEVGAAETVTFTKTNGSLSESVGTTNATTGILNVTLSANTTTGPVTSTVTAYISSMTSQSVTVTFPAAAPLADFAVSIDPPSVVVNTSTPVTVTVTDADSAAVVSSAAVSLSGCGVTDSNTTDTTGIATFDVNATSTGAITVTVSMSGYNTKTETISVTEEAVVGTTGDIIINELMYNPPLRMGSDTNYEWLELYNNDTAEIDMSGWTLDGEWMAVSTISPATTMQPGDYLIIASNKTAFESYYTTVTCTIIDMPTLVLEDVVPQDTIVLKNSTEVEMDNVTYVVSWGADGNGKTLELNATGGWEESTVDDGTPCAENSVIAAPWDPWDYDEDGDEAISKDEVLTAINDYFADKITKDQVLQVINLYFAT